MPTIPRSLEEPAITDEEVFQECSERLRIAMEAESDNRANGVLALAFRDGQQWPDDLYSQRKIDKRPSLTINHTNTFCRRVCNNMRQQRPRIKVHPVADTENEVAQVIEGVIRHIQNMSSADIAYDIGGESAVNIGWGYWRILGDYIDEKSFEQELKIVPVRNTFVGYIDPASVDPSGADMEWFIFSEKMKRSDYAREYPKADNVQWRNAGGGDDMANWESKEEIRLAEYYRIRKVKSTLHQMSNGMAMFTEDMKTLESDLARAKVVPTGNSRPSYRRQVEWYRLNGAKVVDKRTLPGKWIPVIRCEGNVLDMNGRVKRKGMVADLMDPARMYNYWRTMETELLALAPKAPWVGAAGQFDGHPEWADANQKPYSRLEYEPAYVENPDGSKQVLPPPQRTPPVAVPAGAVQAAQGAQQDLMAIAGMPHEPANDTPGTVVSGIALQRRQALSDIGHFQYYDNQTRAIAHTGRILLDLIPFYYSESRMQRIIGEDGVPSMVPINKFDPAVDKVKNDLTVGRYDVVMDTGPGYETKRIEGAEAMIDLLKTPLAEPIAKVGADLVVRNMDFAGSGDLADRLMPMNPQGMQKVVETLPKEARGIVTAMQQQMSVLQQENQGLKLELKYKTSTELGWMQVEREKTKSKLAEVQTNDQTKKEDTHVRAQTAINVAEINAGAKLLDTHVKGGYESEARKDELKAAEKAEKAKPN